DRKIGATAADGEAGQQIGTELIIEPAREPTGVVGEVGAPDACFARELEGAIKAGKPRPPARLVWRGWGHLLEGWMVRRLGLFGRGILQRLAVKGHVVYVDGPSFRPERARAHQDRREQARRAERISRRPAHPSAGERVQGYRKRGETEAEKTGQGPTASVERGVECRGDRRLVQREARD